jgi:uncharacterized phage protein (TIGR02220 family)
MKINAPIIKNIIKLQQEENIEDNKLVLFALAIGNNNASLIKTIKEDLNISQEEIILFLDIFNKNNLIVKKDYELIKKMEKIKLIDIENFQYEIEEIITHINSLTNSKKRITDSRKKLVEKWLKRGYSLDQFKMVNLFFNNKWGKDPTMEQYIRPETLYNTKFPERVEEAENSFSQINKYKEDIKIICEFYYKIFDNIINKNKNLEFSKIGQINMCSYIPFDIQKRIVFWLQKGISYKDILLTIEKTIISWSKKEDLIQHINLLKILDSKFLERLEISKKINLKPKQEKEGISALENWITKGE